MPKPKLFKDVLKAEAEVTGVNPIEATGLALSGGGIRSATFNLGVIQGLAKHKVLRRFDYLSTVSGGGYIGGWLSALIHRSGGGRVEAIEPIIARSLDETDKDAVHVKYLRNYSNYLTPEKGFFSTDTLSAVATYARNLILNQSILILSLALLLMLPRIIHSINDMDGLDLPFSLSAECLLFSVSVLLLLVAVCFISANIAATDAKKWYVFNTIEVVSYVAFPIILASTLLSHLMGLLIQNQSLNTHLGSINLDNPSLIIIPIIASVYLSLWAIASVVFFFIFDTKTEDDMGTAIINGFKNLLGILDSKSIGIHLMATSLSGLIAGMLFWFLFNFTANHYDPIATDWVLIVFGAPVIISIFAITMVYHIGLVGRFFSDKQHEWWSRLGAPLTISMAVWLVLFSIAVFSHALVEWASGKYIIPTLTSGWIASTVLSVITAKNMGAEEQNQQKSYLDTIIQIGPYVFILGLLVAIAYGIQTLSENTAITPILSCAPAESSSPCFRDILMTDLGQMDQFDIAGLWWFACAIAVTFILAWRVNINLFSLHHFYRNRLIRAYLGASNGQRSPHPFTGFDENDDIPIQALKQNNQRPYHLINTAANFTHGENIGYQDRKADSFIFSPSYCGYTDINDKGQQRQFYVPTESYGTSTHGEHKNGFLLGSAVAISGAAANPMMGYHTAPSLAFLLAIFNVRLGRWCGNPKDPEAAKSADPSFGYWYLLSELFGYAGMNKPFIQLSDGGHFENTGLYELVRRGCKHVLVCDAGADPDYAFEDLANAIRKCRADFGVEIEINVDLLRLQNKTCKHSTQHYAVGKIKYGNYLLPLGGAKNAIGTVIILKPSLTAALSTDIQHYAATNRDFPQQTTADQWFDDAQFESYRNLGNHVVEALFNGLSAEEMSNLGLSPG